MKWYREIKRHSQFSGDQFGQVLVPLSALVLVEKVDEGDADENENKSDTEQYRTGYLQWVFADLSCARPV